jgi:hypothetical protein
MKGGREKEGRCERKINRRKKVESAKYMHEGKQKS